MNGKTVTPTGAAVNTEDLNSVLPGFGIELKRKNKEESAGPCPKCGGKDRFCVWDTGKFWCRQCDWKGDKIDFHKWRDGLDFHGLANKYLGNSKVPAIKSVSEWIYHDESGNPVYKVVKKVDGGKKSFIQYRKNGSGWKSGIKNHVSPLPYRLPDVVKSSQLVYICEGEKDADTLASYGFTASCNTGGAGNWPYEISKWFAGKDIIICQDNDDAGRRHTVDLMAKLGTVAESIRVMTFPDLDDKGDVTDWFKEGHNRDDFVKKSERAFTPGGGEGPLRLNDMKSGLDVPNKVEKPFVLTPLSCLEATAPEYLINGILETDSFCAIVGDPASAKSFLAIDIASCVATGNDFHGKRVYRKGPVVYIAGEGQSGIARRFLAWGIRNGIDYKTIPVHVSLQPGQLIDKDNTNSIISAIESIKEGPPVLIVIDTLARNFGPGDENNTADMTEFIQAVDSIRKHASGATILVVHHCGLSDKRRGRGSSALRGALDAEYIISRDEEGVRRFECGKMKDAPPPVPMAFKLRSVELGMDDMHGNPVTSAILDVIEYEEPAAAGRPGRGKNQVKALSVLKRLSGDIRDEMALNGYSTEKIHVSRDKWKSECLSEGIKPNAFWKAEGSLREGGFVNSGNGLVEILN